jgi:hypothetical protein
MAILQQLSFEFNKLFCNQNCKDVINRSFLHKQQNVYLQKSPFKGLETMLKTILGLDESLPGPALF